MSYLKALIFDCDGVIAETERDGHRVSFNRTFERESINAHWSVKDYGDLLKIAGGKERMNHYFKKHRKDFKDKNIDDEYIKTLHEIKTKIFMEMSENGELPIRQGIIRLVDEAHSKDIKLAVCSTSNEKSVVALVRAVMGDERLSWFDSILAGDVVKAKKPAPDIYNLVKEKLNVSGNECFVVEDTRNGMLAAKKAGLNCIVTVSYYSEEEDLSEADIVVSSLGDPHLDPINFLKEYNHDHTPFITVDNLDNYAMQKENT